MLLGKLWQPWKFIKLSSTSALVSYKPVSYNKGNKEYILLWMSDTSVVVCFFYLCLSLHFTVKTFVFFS